VILLKPECLLKIYCQDKLIERKNKRLTVVDRGRGLPQANDLAHLRAWRLSLGCCWMELLLEYASESGNWRYFQHLHALGLSISLVISSLSEG